MSAIAGIERLESERRLRSLNFDSEVHPMKSLISAVICAAAGETSARHGEVNAVSLGTNMNLVALPSERDRAGPKREKRMSRYISIRRIAAAVLVSVAAIQACTAAAPMRKTQAPGFYRMMLGQFEITALSDGSSPLPVSQMLRGVDPGRLTSSLRDAFLDDPVETSLIHLGAVQLANPAITVQYDVDPRMAVRTRERVLAEAAHERYWVAAAHLPFPGIGHLRASGTGYVLVPVNYSSVP